MKKDFRTTDVITISFAHFVHDIFSSFLAPTLPLLISKLGISYSQAGLLSVFQSLPSLLNPAIGYLADKFPVRYLLIFAPTITALSMSFIGLASSYIILIIILLTAGVGASLFHVPGPVMIKRISGNRVGKGMSFFMFGGEIARSAGPVLILGAISLWGLEGSYKMIPLGLLSSAILYFRFRNMPISEDFQNKAKKNNAWPTFIKYRSVFINITAIIFFLSLIKGALTLFLPTYITGTKGGSLWEGGIALSIFQLAGAIGTITSGTVSDKIGRRKTLIIMALVVPVFMIGFMNSSEILGAALLLIIGFFMFASTPVLLAIVNEIDSEHPAFMNSIFMTINFLIQSLAIFFVGILSDYIGLHNTYYISAILGLLALPFIIWLSAR